MGVIYGGTSDARGNRGNRRGSEEAQIEWDGVNFVFRCRDLNREEWERRYLLEMMDRMRTF